MNIVKRMSVAFILLLFLHLMMSAARAQETVQHKPDSEKSKTADVKQLKSKVEQLQSLVEQQQRAIAELQNRLNEMDGKARPAALLTPAKSTESDPLQPA